MIKQYLKKLIKEVLEKDGIESLKIGQHTSYVRNDKIHVKADSPKIHLQGTETSAMNLSVRENAGVLELYDEAAAALRTSWDGTTGRRITPLIAATEIAADAVITAKILDANVTAAKIASDAVITAKILDLNVTTGKLAAAAVTLAKTTFLTGSVTWDPASLVDAAGETSADIAVTGAAFGDGVVVGVPYDVIGCTVIGYVQAAGIVKIRLQNESGATFDGASGVWKVYVIK